MPELREVKIQEQVINVNLQGKNWFEFFGYGEADFNRIHDQLVSDKNIPTTVLTCLATGDIIGILEILRTTMEYLPVCNCHKAPGESEVANEDEGH